MYISSDEEYAHSPDIYRNHSTFDLRLTGNILIALEDALAVKIRHDDVQWLQDNSKEMSILFSAYRSVHTEVQMYMEYNRIIFTWLPGWKLRWRN